MNKTKNTKSDNLKFTDLKETIEFIFKVKEKDLFNNELEKITEEIRSEQYKKIKPFILSNFNSLKILQLNEQYAYTKQFAKKTKFLNHDFSHLVDIDQHKIARNFMLDNLKNNLNSCKKSIEEDLKNLSFIKKRKREIKQNDNTSQKQKKNLNLFEFSSDEIDKINESDHHDNYINHEDKTIKADNQKNTNNEVCENVSNHTYLHFNLKITYQDGSDFFPQYIKITSHEYTNFESFLYVLKKKLGIYEYAKFKLVFLENSREKFFVDSTKQLLPDEVNDLKIVPIEYTISNK